MFSLMIVEPDGNSVIAITTDDSIRQLEALFYESTKAIFNNSRTIGWPIYFSYLCGAVNSSSSPTRPGSSTGANNIFRYHGRATPMEHDHRYQSDRNDDGPKLSCNPKV
jgi:hypothetical protein